MEVAAICCPDSARSSSLVPSCKYFSGPHSYASINFPTADYAHFLLRKVQCRSVNEITSDHVYFNSLNFFIFSHKIKLNIYLNTRICDNDIIV